MSTCADPGIFVRGCPGQADKKSSDNVFFFFFSPQLILQKSNGQFQRNLSLFKVPEGVQHFPGGSNFFQGGGGGGGVQLLIPYRNPYILVIFQEPRSPPLDPHLEQYWIEKNKSHFLVWKGGGGGGLGVLPRKILETKKAGEAISGHYVEAILPTVNEEFQRMLLPFILYALF